MHRTRLVAPWLLIALLCASCRTASEQAVDAPKQETDKPAASSTVEPGVDVEAKQLGEAGDFSRWYFRQKSELLTRFHGRDIHTQAIVHLPANVTPDAPRCFVVGGFSGNHERVEQLCLRFVKNPRPSMVYVYLDATCETGHHVFADSENNGPRGAAFIQEFIPAIEKQFGLSHEPNARFLTGHSSGGWSVLWLLVEYPDQFGGSWSTAPDPVAFGDYCGVNLYLEKNLYTDTEGRDRQLVRPTRGKPGATFREYAVKEATTKPVGGQFYSFDAVFGPRMEVDGKYRPKPMFDRETGAIDHNVVSHWGKYDIVRKVLANRVALEPHLKTKMHVFVGDADTYRLEGAVRFLKEIADAMKWNADIRILAGEDHSSILTSPHFKDGTMLDEVFAAMWQTWESARQR